MLSKLKNFKLKNLVVSLTISAILSTLVVGTLGYFNMRGLNTQIGAMYSEYLIPVADIGSIRSNFYQIKAESIAADLRHTNDVASKIKIYKDNIDKYLSDYEKTKMDEQGTKYINDFKTTYKFFSALWDKTGTNDSSININQIQDEESKMESSLSALQAYDEKLALNNKEICAKAYSASERLMLIIFALSLAIFTVIAYIVILVINRPSKEMVSTLQQVSEGDFNAKFNNNSKNEFGLMNSALEKTILNISDMIKSVKDTANNINVAIRLLMCL